MLVGAVRVSRQPAAFDARGNDLGSRSDGDGVPRPRMLRAAFHDREAGRADNASHAAAHRLPGR